MGDERGDRGERPTRDERIERLGRLVRERGDLLTLTHDVALIANESRDTRTALARTVERVCEETAWTVGHAFLQEDEDAPSLVASGIWWFAEEGTYEDLIAVTAPLEIEAGEGLLGEVLRTGKPALVTDLTAEPRFLRQETASRCGLRGYTALPVPVGRRVAGVLEFFHAAPIEPREELERALVQVVTAVGRVIEREEAARQIARISEIEQRRIGRDLHDDIAQRLVGARMIARSLQRRLQGEGSPSAERAGTLAGHLAEAVARVRDLSHGLTPVEIDARSLSGALRALADTFSRLYELPCRAELDEDFGFLDAETALHLYRIAQEALTNAARHAQSDTLWLSLRADAEATVLEVRDQGVGFDSGAPDVGGVGLQLMRHRSRLVGGTLSIESRTGSGTVVRCRVDGPPR